MEKSLVIPTPSKPNLGFLTEMLLNYRTHNELANPILAAPILVHIYPKMCPFGTLGATHLTTLRAVIYLLF